MGYNQGFGVESLFSNVCLVVVVVVIVVGVFFFFWGGGILDLWAMIGTIPG